MIHMAWSHRHGKSRLREEGGHEDGRRGRHGHRRARSRTEPENVERGAEGGEAGLDVQPARLARLMRRGLREALQIAMVTRLELRLALALLGPRGLRGPPHVAAVTPRLGWRPLGREIERLRCRGGALAAPQDRAARLISGAAYRGCSVLARVWARCPERRWGWPMGRLRRGDALDGCRGLGGTRFVHQDPAGRLFVAPGA